MRTLVVDDSRIIRSILVRILRSLGIREIVEAADGREAWDAFTANPIDLVLTDWHMPHVDGLELTKRIRAVNPEVPIVMITVVDSCSWINEAFRVGVTEFISKPLNRETLESKLDRWLPSVPSLALPRSPELVPPP